MQYTKGVKVELVFNAKPATTTTRQSSKVPHSEKKLCPKRDLNSGLIQVHVGTERWTMVTMKYKR